MANDLSAFNAQLWSKMLIENLDQINFMLPKVNRAWEGQLNNVGDTVQVRTLGNVVMGSYGKNSTTISYQDLSPVKEPLTVSDSQYFAFEVDDVDGIQNDMDLLQLYSQRAAVAVSNKVEAKILAAYAGAYTANVVAGSGGAAITLDSTTASSTGIYQQIVAAEIALSNQNVPLEGRWMVLDPKSVGLILNDTAHFIRATSLGDGVVQQGTVDGKAPSQESGYMGMCSSFRIYQSTALPIVNGVKYMPFGNNNAIAYVAQLKTIETIRLQDRFATAVRGLLLHDTKVFAEASKQLGYIAATP